MSSIIICDDSRYMRELCRAVLEDGGYEVAWCASSGEEAVQKYEELRPDAVVVDLALPKMDGISVIRRIRSIDSNARIAMMSAYGTRNKVIEALRAGAQDFIVKPFGPDRLLGSLGRLITLVLPEEGGERSGGGPHED